jgi:catalase
MRTDSNYGGAKSYEPNSFSEWQQQPDYSEPPLKITGDAAQWDHKEDDDYYSQPGNLFRLMSAEQRQSLFNNTAAAVGGAQQFIQIRHIRNCYKADPGYGMGVANALGLSMQLVRDYEGYEMKKMTAL